MLSLIKECTCLYSNGTQSHKVCTGYCKNNANKVTLHSFTTNFQFKTKTKNTVFVKCNKAGNASKYKNSCFLTDIIKKVYYM